MADRLTDHPDYPEMFRVSREQVWGEFAPRFERLVAAGNTAGADRIQARVDERARQRAIVALRSMTDFEAGRGPLGRQRARPTGIDYSQTPGRASPLSVLTGMPREELTNPIMTPEEIGANSGIIQRLLGMFGATREAALAWERERAQPTAATTPASRDADVDAAVSEMIREMEGAWRNNTFSTALQRAGINPETPFDRADRVTTPDRGPPTLTGWEGQAGADLARGIMEGSPVDFGERMLTPGGRPPPMPPNLTPSAQPPRSTVFREEEMTPAVTNALLPTAGQREEMQGEFEGLPGVALTVAPWARGAQLAGQGARLAGQGAAWLGRTARANPVPTIATATALGGVPPAVTEQRPDPNAAPGPGMRPSITQQTLDAVFGAGNAVSRWLDGNAQFAPTDREDFFRQRRSTRQSLEEAQRTAEQAVRDSDEYKDLIERGRTTQAQRLITQAHASAAARVRASEGTRPQEEERIGREYQDHIRETERRRAEFYNKSWNERGGGVATMVSAAAYVVPYLLARRGFNKIANEGTTLIGNVRRARAAGNAADEARALLALDRWGDRALGRRAWVVLKAAAIPAEIRAGGNLWDALVLPEGTGAQTRARGHLTHGVTSVGGFLEEYGPSILGGLATAAGARLTSRNPPFDEAFGERATLRGTGFRAPTWLDRALGRRNADPDSPEEIARIITGRRTPTTTATPTPTTTTTTAPPPRMLPPTAGGPVHEPGVTRYRNPATGAERYLDEHGRWRGPIHSRGGRHGWTREPPASWERISLQDRIEMFGGYPVGLG